MNAFTGHDTVIGLGGGPFALIPVLVTVIQERRVRGAEESFAPKDLGWLDSCDEHRNEDQERPGRTQSTTHSSCCRVLWNTFERDAL